MNLMTGYRLNLNLRPFCLDVDILSQQTCGQFKITWIQILSDLKKLPCIARDSWKVWLKNLR